ncbi:MAG: hypothetical protein M1825_003527 [Sarcosagium campestre]|nr:MAG: hypothetical protein M1825_003527 [Sarcosagium campestre]
MTLDEKSLRNYLADSPPTVVRLEIKPHFEALTDREKRYAHHISRASFLGTRIILRQVSPEAESIFDFILSLYESSKGDWSGLAQRAKISDQELRYFLEYAGQFLGNVGNYKAVGDAKILPRLSEASIQALASVEPRAKEALDKTDGAMFARGPSGLLHLGYLDQGHLSTYYPDSPGISKEEITLIGDLLDAKQLGIYNTRLRKTASGDFELLVASAAQSQPEGGGDAGDVREWELEGTLAGKKLRFVYGDHSKELTAIVEEIQHAGENAANDDQRQMHQEYATSFRTGSAEAFKRSQRCWIRDKGPTVESDIGFIESYRDPHGVRAEWEGFVAMVNKERTQAFSRLVASAESMIPKLPWPADFEKDDFLSPDFTSLEVLSFAGSMIPAGINIPNLDDVRQQDGFKNVSLGNVLSAKAPHEPIPFIRPQDSGVYEKSRDGAFEVQVGIHELLGHGTGKLLQETSPGVFNFDRDHPPHNPVTGAPVETYYKPGQTWGSLFGSISSSYEECRAECVAMALSCDPDILKLFGFHTASSSGGGTDSDGAAATDQPRGFPYDSSPASDVLFTAYLQMARAGLTSLEFYDPRSRKWGQAHAQARFSILRCFLEAGDGFLTLTPGPPSASGETSSTTVDLSNLTVAVDRSKILSHGRPAIEAYLRKLHIYKSTADLAAGTRLYEHMTAVDDWWGGPVRDEVMKRKSPRKVFVQANTLITPDGKGVVLKEYEASLEGMIQSWAEQGV